MGRLNRASSEAEFISPYYWEYSMCSSEELNFLSSRDDREHPNVAPHRSKDFILEADGQKLAEW